MYCRHCGNQISDEARFCPFCGSTVDIQPQQAVKPTATPVQTPVSVPARPVPQEETENKAPVKGLVFGILALVSTLVMLLVYRRLLFPMTMSGAPLSREIGPFLVVLFTDFFALVMIVLNGVFGIMGLVKGIVKQKNLVLGIVAVILLVLNVILFFYAAGRVISLSNYVTNYWLGKLYW